MDDRQLPDLSSKPGAAGADMRWFFLGFSGRIGRLPYILGTLFLVALSAGAVSQIASLPEDSFWVGPWFIFLMVLSGFTLWSCTAMAVKRLHDFNIPGPVAICIFVPAVSPIAMLVMCLWPGTAGPNDYGDETNRPKGNRT